MNHKILTGIAVILFVSSSISWSQFSINIGAGTGLTTFRYRQGNYSFHVESSYLVSQQWSVGLSAGYQRFLSGGFGQPDLRTEVFPLLVQSKYLIIVAGDFRPYVAAEAGITQTDWELLDYSIFAANFFEFEKGTVSKRRKKEWAPMISLGVGALTPLAESVYLDYGVRLGMYSAGPESERVYLVGRGASGQYLRDGSDWSYIRFIVGVVRRF